MTTEIERKELFVHPGEIIVKHAPAVLWTVLGSCVSVILYDVKKRIVGMNHYMLPAWNGKENPTAMYGDIAIRNLISRMLAMGCRIEDLQARIVGGAEQTNKTFEIGKKNINVAFEAIRKENIHIICSQIGGACGRKIKFISSKGELYIKALNEAQKIDTQLVKKIK
ncbi:putative chemoreceptor glutamine deamidase CheD [Marivirga lumbricoides]|uniref:Probable chemoreceptor glutamine deamidase CheD n=1 Tax=Marivirga lumbricoides TaxID=1046115 RepID=A0ABQ1N1X5_9BACT|nr:putative chemoreceptor glutamine deamidase CheD [Marivirga lumbricoides]